MNRLAVLFAVLLAAVGCQRTAPSEAGGAPDGGGAVLSKTDAGIDGGQPDTGSDVYPAPHQGPPQVVSGGGPVLTSPVFQPVFFANDDHSTNGAVDQLTTFAARVGQSSYWTTAVSEYGVGPAISGTPFNSSETMSGTITDAQIQTWIANAILNVPGFPQPTDNTVYVMDYPKNVSITLQGGGGPGGGTEYSCQDFGGYHSDFKSPAAKDDPDGGTADGGSGHPAKLPKFISYAVVPRCASFGNLEGLNGTTGAESHELVEASTDPYPNNDPAFVQVDEAHIFWEFAVGGGEVGDMCAQNPGAFTQFSDLPYTVQRIWSNKNVKAGHDPCQPELPNEVYFNSVPELNNTLSLEMGEITIDSVNVAVGSSTTIPLQLYSDGPTDGVWQVSVMDESQLEGGAPQTDFTLNRGTGLNGDTLQLTIAPQTATQYGADVFFVISTMGNYTNLWIGAVGEN